MKNTRRRKKIRNLIVICFICAIILSVGTYAWFIGMKTVNVSSFDVEIATTEGLYMLKMQRHIQVIQIPGHQQD